MKKMWGARFSDELHVDALVFTRSIEVDGKLAEYDIRGSIVHVQMLKECGIIGSADARKIERGLKALLQELKKGNLRFSSASEDVHSDIEAKLEKLVGKAAKKLHTARSRNDQVCLDIRMYCRDAINSLAGKITGLQKALLAFAGKNTDVIIPGFTHLQYAQPILFAHQLLTYVEMLERDKERLNDAYRRTDVLPLGSCALAGTGLPINRRLVAARLGFKRISSNSLDAVSDRDFVAEILNAAALAGMHLSRFAEDMILMTSPEFGYLEIADSFATGSSIMPQKKNPDVLELVRGRVGRIYGNLISVLVTMKGLPLSYNRDLQEDKRPLFEAVETLSEMLDILAQLSGHIRVKRAVIKEKVKDEFLVATDLVEYLVGKSVPFREAHERVGRLVKYCLEEKCMISGLDLKKLKSFCGKFEKDVYAKLNPKTSVKTKISFGSTGPANVKRELAKWKKKLRR